MQSKAAVDDPLAHRRSGMSHDIRVGLEIPDRHRDAELPAEFMRLGDAVNAMAEEGVRPASWATFCRQWPRNGYLDPISRCSSGSLPNFGAS